MNHVHDLLTAYVDGRLEGADRAAVDAHCATCPACARALGETRAVWDLMGEARAPEPTRSVWSAVAAETAPDRAPAWRRVAFAAVSAAAVAGGVLIGAQQYAPGAFADLDALDDALAGTTLVGDAVWSLDTALDYALYAGEAEED